MINYTDNSNIEKIFELERNSINATFDIQKMLNKQILTFLKNFMSDYEINSNDNSESTPSKYLAEATSALAKSNDNINYIKELTACLNNINIQAAARIKSSVKKYNKMFSSSMEKIYSNTSQIEDFIHNISMVDLSEMLKKESSLVQEQNPEEDESFISTKELNSSFVENTLIISSIQNKVILPYTIDKIYQILSNQTDLTSINEVIEKLYTKPLRDYRFPAFSRFREGYHLMLNKEHKSKMEAIIYAAELFTNYNLHPAIITACESQEQLDIYLSCLDDNKLEEFNFFTIKFEIPPSSNTVKC